MVDLLPRKDLILTIDPENKMSQERIDNLFASESWTMSIGIHHLLRF